MAVISRSLNDTLFGGDNSVGKELMLDHHSYRIVGVRDTWNPQPLFYDVKMLGAFGEAAQIFTAPQEEYTRMLIEAVPAFSA